LCAVIWAKVVSIPTKSSSTI